mmetsp:Transcript_59368/g.156303  ORF Transcript_59368/g.156303 Transcript_59368/m.156303 type:complete len:388 (+) Transcript_59368:829-1992(+)
MAARPAPLALPFMKQARWCSEVLRHVQDGRTSRSVRPRQPERHAVDVDVARGVGGRVEQHQVVARRDGRQRDVRVGGARRQVGLCLGPLLRAEVQPEELHILRRPRALLRPQLPGRRPRSALAAHEAAARRVGVEHRALLVADVDGERQRVPHELEHAGRQRELDVLVARGRRAGLHHSSRRRGLQGRRLGDPQPLLDERGARRRRHERRGHAIQAASGGRATALGRRPADGRQPLVAAHARELREESPAPYRALRSAPITRAAVAAGHRRRNPGRLRAAHRAAGRHRRAARWEAHLHTGRRACHARGVGIVGRPSRALRQHATRSGHRDAADGGSLAAEAPAVGRAALALIVVVVLALDLLVLVAIVADHALGREVHLHVPLLLLL